MNKKVNKDIITNYKDCKYYKKGKEKTALSGLFFHSFIRASGF
jgi:hypothetical protein